MDELLTVKQVARIFGVSERTIWRWEASGTLTALRIEGTVRFRKSQIDALLSHEG